MGSFGFQFPHILIRRALIDVYQKTKQPITAQELKKDILGEKGEVFHVIAFTDNGSWWHVHNDEEVPENWALKPVAEDLPWYDRAGEAVGD